MGDKRSLNHSGCIQLRLPQGLRGLKESEGQERGKEWRTETMEDELRRGA